MPLDPNQTYRFAPKPMAGLWTDPTATVHASTSGHERNRLFANQFDGRSFVDLSALSGADDVTDARAFAWLDFDRDGWHDLAVANAAKPFLRLFRNRIGDTAEAGPRGKNIVAVRVVGSQRRAAPERSRTNRDGIGAQVVVQRADGRSWVRERRAGEGFAAQNSATMIVPLGDPPSGPVSISVRWPSGRRTEADNVAPGSLVVLHEGDGDGEARFEVQAYHPSPPPTLAQGVPPARPALPWIRGVAKAEPSLVLVTTMATWCPSCRRELPALQRLRTHFGPSELAMLAVPIDPEDDDDALDAYLMEVHPPYELLREDRPARTEDLRDAAAATIKRDVLPTSFLARADGEILQVVAGVPTRSEILRWLENSQLEENR